MEKIQRMENYNGRCWIISRTFVHKMEVAALKRRGSTAQDNDGERVMLYSSSICIANSNTTKVLHKKSTQAFFFNQKLHVILFLLVV